jgi:hypothetical protein
MIYLNANRTSTDKLQKNISIAPFKHESVQFCQIIKFHNFLPASFSKFSSFMFPLQRKPRPQSSKPAFNPSPSVKNLLPTDRIPFAPLSNGNIPLKKSKKVKRCQVVSWENFKGDPGNSPYYAWTAWTTRYNLHTIPLHNGVRVTGITLHCFLDEERSWAKKDKVTDELLLHEQGHLDIGYIAALEFKKKVMTMSEFGKNYKEEIRGIYRRTDDEFQKMQHLYDKETDHFKNKQKQLEWNNKIRDMLIGLREYC